MTKAIFTIGMFFKIVTEIMVCKLFPVIQCTYNWMHIWLEWVMLKQCEDTRHGNEHDEVQWTHLLHSSSNWY